MAGDQKVPGEDNKIKCDDFTALYAMETPSTTSLRTLGDATGNEYIYLKLSKL